VPNKLGGSYQYKFGTRKGYPSTLNQCYIWKGNLLYAVGRWEVAYVTEVIGLSTKKVQSGKD